MQDNLAAAERLRDRGLLADALYVKALLALLVESGKRRERKRSGAGAGGQPSAAA